MWSGLDTGATLLATARVDLPKDQRYIVSVLPWHSSPAGTPAFKQTGWTMSGRNVAINQTDVTVVVHKFPVATAQLTIIVFEDNQPTNGQNEPVESPLGGFNIILFDPAGRTGCADEVECARVHHMHPKALPRRDGSRTRARSDPPMYPCWLKSR